jgi:hypothetical protein
MSNFSRRSLVTSAAALPALTVPAIANALPVGADIELQQLGVRLLRIKRELAAIDAIADGEDYDAAFEVVNGRLCALMDPIYSLTATTIDGLAVQAAAVTIAAADIWDNDPDEEAPLGVERRFIEAVCRYTGVEHPPINVAYAQGAAAPTNVAPSPTNDPIFKAIEEFKTAFAVVESSYKDKSDAEEGFLERHGTLSPDGISKELRDHWSKDGFAEFAKARAPTHQSITKLKGEVPPEVLAMFHRELNQQTADYEANVETRESAADDAWNVMVEKRDIMFNTAPTTAGGFAALVALIDDKNKYCLQDHFRTEWAPPESGEVSSLNLLLQTLTRSAFTLAGLTPQHSEAA